MGAVEVRLFGPMLVLSGGNPVGRMRSRKGLWLLALLSLRGNRPVSREWLATMLWPDADLSVAYNNLRPVLSELRRTLGEEGWRVEAVDRNTLRLAISGMDIDVLRFDEAVWKGDWATAAGLYTGPLLEDCAEEWVPQERTAREADCLRAVQALGEAANGRGEYGEALGHFARATAMDTWRDAPRRGAMSALAAKGDVNAALQMYREFAHLLSSEAGTAPDAQTTELYERLRKEARLGGKGRVSEPERPAVKRVGRLPHAITSLVGRDDERLDIAARLRGSRLVTLLGPGGIGKTRLAARTGQDVAAEYPDGVWFVGLEGVTEDRMVVTELLSTLQIGDEAGRSPLQSVRLALCDQRALIVLDNCEHLIEACAELAGALLRDCGKLRILATSREPLGLAGERVWMVPPLAVPNPEGLPKGRTTLLRVMEGYEGVRLFVERAREVRPDFELTAENAGPVAAICARMDGVPLALELAAARLQSLSPEGIAERLGDSLRLLGGSRGTPTKRQQTLRATIDWSHSLLNEEEQILLRRLAVFSGGWSADAAETVGGDYAMESLASLVGKSLVVFDREIDRYRYLETVRQYAVERLDASGERPRMEEEMRAWAIELAERSEKEFNGPAQSAWADRLDLEGDNLRSAMELCDGSPEAGLRLTGALGRYWYFRNRFSEGRRWLTQALSRPDAGTPTPALSQALSAAGMLAYAQKDLDAAAPLYERCLEVCRTLGDAGGVARATCNLGSMAFYRHDMEQAIAFYEESLSYQQTLGDDRNAGLIFANLGMVHESLGHYDRARGFCGRALELFRKVGDERSVAWTLKQQGDLAFLAGEFGDARGFYEEALLFFREGKDDNGVAETLAQLAPAMVELGFESEVASQLEEAGELYERMGNAVGRAVVRVAQGAASLRAGDFQAARAGLERVLENSRDAHFAQVCAHARVFLGRVALLSGNLAEAESHLVSAHGFFVESGDRRGGESVLEGFAALRLAQGDCFAGVFHLGTAEALREELETPLLNSERASHCKTVAGLRGKLGEARFSGGRKEGRGADWRVLDCPVLA